jgi:hypothetical protein
LHIDPQVHEKFVEDFGLNMLNTLTSKEHRLTAHKRRIHVFDERGGVMGGDANTIQQYQNLTTGVFHSKSRKVVGVKYRCLPNNLSKDIIGAFHTHPALYDRDVNRVRRRIDQMLWLSEMDKVAFFKQYEMYGYEWHFIGCIDIGCFNIHDLLKGQFHPRYVLRYPRLEELMERLGPTVEHFDRVLSSQQVAPRSTKAGALVEVVQNLTQRDGQLSDILLAHSEEMVRSLAKQVASECQLRGLTLRQVTHMLEKTIPAAKEREVAPDNVSISVFRHQVIHAYDSLGHLV